jgi:PAS domain S-box-containing protein
MKENEVTAFGVRGSIGGRFAVIIVLISLLSGVVLALFLASVTAKYARDDYKRMITRLHVSSEDILVKGLWLTNDEVVQTVLEGFISLSGVENVVLITENGSVIEKGKAVSEHFFVHEHALTYHYQDQAIALGQLSVRIELDSINRQIVNETIRLSLVVGLLALVGGAGTIFLFYTLVGRHLQNIAQHCGALQWTNLQSPLILNRVSKNKSGDELDQIAYSLNETCISLNRSMSEVQEKESLFKTIVASSSDTILRFDIDGIITYANPAAEEQLGSKWQHFIDKKLKRTTLQEICKTKQSIEVKLQAADQAGTNNNRLFNLKLTPEISSDGSVNGVIGIARDISMQDQKDVLLRAVFNHAPMLMAIEEIDTGKFYDVNDRFLEMTGYAKDRIIGKSSVAVGFNSVGNRDLIKIHLSSNGFFDDLELDFTSCDGITMTCHCSGQIIDVLGNKKLLSIFQDVTLEKKMLSEQRALEHQVLQSSKIEAIGTLAGGIAHDFNNILMAILGYGQMALEDTSPESSVHGDLQQILLAGRRASELTKQILLFSRQGNDELSPYKLQGVVKEVVKLLRSTMPSTIEIVTDINLKCRPATLDPTQIHQVLMNILTNAKQAIGASHGKIEVILREIDWNASMLSVDGKPMPKGKYLELSIKDSGKGMSAEILSRMFEPFFTTKAKGEGTGMGMAVCHGIISKHNGSITVDSSPGKGSKFNIYLPVTGESHQDLMAKIDDGASIHGNERILLVDDEKELLKMQDRSLTKLGYQTVCFSNSIDALDYFQEHFGEIDMLVTDMTMPHLTGAELSQKILQVSPDLPIIICTGYSEVLDAETAYEIGIKSYILKPVVISELATKMRIIFDGLDHRWGDDTRTNS